ILHENIHRWRYMTLVYRFVEHGPLMPYSWHIPNRKSTPRCLDGAFNAWFARSTHVRMSAPLQHLVSAYFVWVLFNALKFSLHLVIWVYKLFFSALTKPSGSIILVVALWALFESPSIFAPCKPAAADINLLRTATPKVRMLWPMVGYYTVAM